MNSHVALIDGLPFLEIAVVAQRAFDTMVNHFFLCNRPIWRTQGDDRGGALELNSEQELANTRQKLTMLEASYVDMQNDTTENSYVREASLRSLKRLINQLKEEIARYEAHQVVRR